MLQDKFDQVGVVILAAGKGTRLKCADQPKVMLEIGNKPIVSYTVETLESLGFGLERICLVVGFHKEIIMNYFNNRVSYVDQEQPLGTAHAAYHGSCGLPRNIKHVLVMGGDDSAFYSAKTLEHFIAKHIQNNVVLSLLTVELKDPDQLGRIVRHSDGNIEIIEKEYLTEEQKKIKEISTGTFCFNREWFEGIFPNMPLLRKLDEYGLPTALAVARETGRTYQVVQLKNSNEWFGINTPEELKEADRRKRFLII